MKFILAILMLGFTTVAASADQASIEDARILNNPVVQGFIQAQSQDKSCQILKPEGRAVMWMCTGLVMEGERDAFAAIKKTKLDTNSQCGFAIFFDCSTKNVMLFGNVSSTQVVGADNKPYGAPYETITFEEVVEQEK